MPEKPIVLLVSDEYPPYTALGGNAYQMAHLARMLTGHGHDVEVIAESDTDEEFIHLDACGNLVHRVAGSRSTLLASLRALLPPAGRLGGLRDLSFALRVLEKVLELELLWQRHVLWIEATSWRSETFFL